MFGQEDVFKILAAARLLYSVREGDFFTSIEDAGIPPVISTQPNRFFVGQKNTWVVTISGNYLVFFARQKNWFGWVLIMGGMPAASDESPFLAECKSRATASILNTSSCPNIKNSLTLSRFMLRACNKHENSVNLESN